MDLRRIRIIKKLQHHEMQGFNIVEKNDCFFQKKHQKFEILIRNMKKTVFKKKKMKKAETQKFFDQFHKQGHQKMRIDEYFHLQKTELKNSQ